MAEEMEREDAPEIEADDAPEAEQPAPPADPEPQEDDVEAEARSLGWKPREAWKGDASNWVDASEYVERARSLPATVKRLETALEAERRESRERLARMEAYYERTRKAERETIDREMREAVRTGDVDAYEAARKREQAITAPVEPQKPAGPPPETREWVQRNAWFETDPVMRAAAQSLADEALRLGRADVTSQLAYVDQRIKEYFPHKFQPPAPKRTVSPVDGGTMIAPKSRAKGWSDIPAEERALIRKDIGRVFKTEKEAADAYWSEYG